MTRYIGLDVHQHSCTAVVLNAAGKRLRTDVLEKRADVLRDFARAMGRPRHVERIHRETLPSTSFIHFIRASLWRTWLALLGASDRWASIARRDRGRFTNRTATEAAEEVAAIRAQRRAPEQAGDQSITFIARQEVAEENAAKTTARSA